MRRGGSEGSVPGQAADEVSREVGAHLEPGFPEPGAETVPGCEVGVAPRGAGGTPFRGRAEPGNGFHTARDAFALHAVRKGLGSASPQESGPEGSGGSRAGKEIAAGRKKHPCNCVRFGLGGRGAAW